MTKYGPSILFSSEDAIPSVNLWKMLWMIVTVKRMKIMLMLEGWMLTKCLARGHNNINNDVGNCDQWQQ